MANNRLNVIAVSAEAESNEKPQRKRYRDEASARFEREWLIDSEQFNPMRNARERERIKRTLELVAEYFSPAGCKVVDLGCGWGTLTEHLAQQGAQIDAVDIALHALNRIKEKHISNVTAIQDYVPNTKLQDDHYDLCLSTELIACLTADQYRLYFSELARLIHQKGLVVCSTAIDIHSDDALARFASLAETEFQIKKWIFSYHALHIRICNFLSIPKHYAKAKKDPEYRQKELDKRHSFAKWWFKFNSSIVLGSLWNAFSILLRPLLRFIEQSPSILNKTEQLCRFIWSDSGISHAIFIGNRHSLIEPHQEEPAVERKHRKEVWE